MTRDLPKPDASAATWVRAAAGMLLAGLLLILALRMTGSEELRETLNQRGARMANPQAQVVTPGPPTIVAESVFTFLIAGAALALAAIDGRLTWKRIGHWGLLAVLAGCGMVSVLHSENRFNAVVGLADFGMGVAGGLAAAVLLETLGDAGRRTLIAGIMAILTICIGKGMLQKFIEFPDLAAYVRDNQEEVLRNQGIADDPVQAKLFLTRIASGEVSGYLAFSNVFAAALIGLLAVAIGVTFVAVRRFVVAPPPATASSPGPGQRPGVQITPEAIAAFMAAFVLLAGLALLPLTGSKGGALLGAGVAIAIAAGGIAWRQIVRWRGLLIGAGVVLLLLGAAGILAYGMKRDALPSKSLLFRWHYWSASAPIIREHAAWGVGLNNFGDYYLAYKRPSSPEDVKDPHSYFVRLAAELGIPAAVFAGVLLVWMFAGALRRRRAEPVHPPEGPSGAFIALACATMLAWALLHLMFFETAVEFNLYVTGFFALAALGVFALTMMALRTTGDFPAIRYVAIAATLGALGMMIYEQINMALVTGPVAMLFWMLLGLGDSCSPATIERKTPLRVAGIATAIATAGAAIVMAIGLWLPLLKGTMPWDSAPDETEVLERWQARDVPGALAALDRAIEKSPRSLEFKIKRIGVMQMLHQPVAAAIRDALTLDRANASIRLNLALPDTDLPPTERIAALREALAFDAQLPSEEYKRLSPEKIAQVKATIAALEAAATATSPH